MAIGARTDPLPAVAVCCGVASEVVMHVTSSGDARYRERYAGSSIYVTGGGP